MKAVIFILLGACALQSTFVAAANEKGNGGDVCLQSIPKIKALITSSLEYGNQIEQFPEFEMNVLQWFFRKTTVNVVAKTVIDGEESDAANYPDKKLIELNRGRWCALDVETKTRVLFHEYLGILGIEKTGEYSISDRLQIILDPTRFICHFSYIHSSYSDRYVYATAGHGATAVDAWDHAVKRMGDGQPCVKWDSARDCLEPATVVNSCMVQK